MKYEIVYFVTIISLLNTHQVLRVLGQGWAVCLTDTSFTITKATHIALTALTALTTLTALIALTAPTALTSLTALQQM